MFKDNNSTAKGKVAIPEVRFLLKQPYEKETATQRKKREAKNKPKPLNKDSTLIRAIFRYGGDDKKLVYTTKHKIKPKHWLFDKQKPKKSYNLESEIKEDMDIIEQAIIDTFLKLGKSKSTKDYKDALDFTLGRSKKEDQIKSNRTKLIPFISDYIERKEKLQDVKPNTIKKYTTTKNKLEEYSRWKQTEIDFNDITIGFRDHFLHWLYNHTKSQSPNTANKQFATLKLLLKKAYKEGLHTNMIFEDEDFGVKRVRTSKIALSEDELDTLFHLKIKDHDLLKEKNISTAFARKVKDWFLVAAYSSLRWGDFSQLNQESIIELNGGHFIHTWTEKTNEEVYIPINQRLLTILEEYDYTSPSMSSQRFNEAIKVVCEIAGITQKVPVNKSEKGKMKVEFLRKCDNISSHDGRRTWASINYSKGFPILLLMQVTGHRKESTFLSYIGISKKELAIKLMEQMKSEPSKLKVV